MLQNVRHNIRWPWVQFETTWNGPDNIRHRDDDDAAYRLPSPTTSFWHSTGVSNNAGFIGGGTVLSGIHSSVCTETNVPNFMGCFDRHYIPKGSFSHCVVYQLYDSRCEPWRQFR